MTRPLIAGNWKMHGTLDTASELARAVAASVSDGARADVLVCPPFPHLGAVAGVLRGSPVAPGAQHAHFETEGAFTGEVSMGMIAELGARYVLVGHSERRQFFGATDTVVRRTTEAALAAGLTPIVCVGETEAEREDGFTEAVLEHQLVSALDGLDLDGRALEIAYEPVWAIGTGRTATPEIAADAHGILRRVAARAQTAEWARHVRILYGGSVNARNAAELLAADGVDGALVGGASLDAAAFAAIVEAVPRRR